MRTEAAATRGAALAAADEIGYPVVLKTDEPGIAHKSDVGGVRLGLASPAEAGAAYDDLAARLGPRVLVCRDRPARNRARAGRRPRSRARPPPGHQRRRRSRRDSGRTGRALAPVTRSAALAALRRLRIAPVLAGSRGQPGADLGAIADAITGLSRLACDLGDAIEALDINPLICGPYGALAVDALLIPPTPTPTPRRLALARSTDRWPVSAASVPRTGHDRWSRLPTRSATITADGEGLSQWD